MCLEIPKGSLDKKCILHTDILNMTVQRLYQLKKAIRNSLVTGTSLRCDTSNMYIIYICMCFFFTLCYTISLLLWRCRLENNYIHCPRDNIISSTYSLHNFFLTRFFFCFFFGFLAIYILLSSNNNKFD